MHGIPLAHLRVPNKHHRLLCAVVPWDISRLLSDYIAMGIVARLVLTPIGHPLIINITIVIVTNNYVEERRNYVEERRGAYRTCVPCHGQVALVGRKCQPGDVVRAGCEDGEKHNSVFCFLVSQMHPLPLVGDVVCPVVVLLGEFDRW